MNQNFLLGQNTDETVLNLPAKPTTYKELGEFMQSVQGHPKLQDLWNAMKQDPLFESVSKGLLDLATLGKGVEATLIPADSERVRNLLTILLAQKKPDVAAESTVDTSTNEQSIISVSAH